MFQFTLTNGRDESRTFSLNLISYQRSHDLDHNWVNRYPLTKTPEIVCWTSVKEIINGHYTRLFYYWKEIE